MNLIKRKIENYIEKNFKVWGVDFETNLPPDFIITDHAQKRFKERFNCREDKIKRIIMKAWGNKEEISQKLLKKLIKRDPASIYKTFNGYVFVFKTIFNKKLGYNQKILITLYDPKIDEIFNI